MKKSLIIFDMDGTLYDLNDVLQMCYNMQVTFFSEKTGRSHTEVKLFFAENGIFPKIRKESKSATELFIRLGLSIDEWSKYRDEHFNVDAINIDKAVKDELLSKFAKESTLILLSSNSFSCISKVFSHIHCSLSHFSEIVCSDRYLGEGRFNKKNAMKLLTNQYSISYSNIVSIGDRFKTDIEPILELGGEGVLLKNNSALEKVFDDLMKDNLSSCDVYEYYK